MKTKYGVVTRRVKVCPSCGAEVINQNGTYLCPNCGSQFTEMEVDYADKEIQQEKNSRTRRRDK